MAINFDAALGIHPQALALREQRSAVLAANMANADTPGYKARDLDFQSVLKQALPSALPVEQTRQGHLTGKGSALGEQLLFRVPQQASLDGNTVEEQVEQAKFSQNAVQYQASLRFINGKISGLMTAIRGE